MWACVSYQCFLFLFVTSQHVLIRAAQIQERKNNKIGRKQEAHTEKQTERERVHVCVCGRSFHLHSSTCCFPSLSQTQPVRNSDIYSINCQHNQHRYVRSLTSNTANTAETEAAVYLTQPLKYSTTVYRALNWLQLSLQTVSFLQGFFFLLFLFSFFNQSYHLILNQTLLSVLF